MSDEKTKCPLCGRMLFDRELICYQIRPKGSCVACNWCVEDMEKRSYMHFVDQLKVINFSNGATIKLKKGEK